jgi:hypothetical protein
MRAEVDVSVNAEKARNDGHTAEKIQGRLTRLVTDTLDAAMRTLPPSDIVSRIQPGDYVVVFIAEAEGPTLRGAAFAKSSMAEFHSHPIRCI